MFDDIFVNRFWSKVEPQDSGCWVWIGSKNGSGYGAIGYKRKRLLAHRVSLILSGGKFAEDEVCDHICRNRSCVNPSHLRAVSKRINSIENSIGPTAKNHAKTHCKRGHELSGENLRLKGGGRECVACQKQHASSHLPKRDAIRKEMKAKGIRRTQ